VEAGAVDSLQVNYSGTNFSRHTFSLMMRSIIQGECGESLEIWETKIPQKDNFSALRGNIQPKTIQVISVLNVVKLESLCKLSVYIQMTG